MNMKLLTPVIITFLLTANLSFGQDWTTEKLTDFSTIDFPITPERMGTPQEAVLHVTDSFGVYLVAIKEISNSEPPRGEIPEFYKGVINGTIDAANGELLSKTDFEVNGIPGVEILYFANSNPELPEIRHKRILLANGHLFTIDFWTTSELADSAIPLKTRFFDSFNITERDEEMPSDRIEEGNETDNSTAYNIGYFLGRIFVIVVIIGLVVGVIFIVRRNRKQ